MTVCSGCQERDKELMERRLEAVRLARQIGAMRADLDRLKRHAGITETRGGVGSVIRSHPRACGCLVCVAARSAMAEAEREAGR